MKKLVLALSVLAFVGTTHVSAQRTVKRTKKVTYVKTQKSYVRSLFANSVGKYPSRDLHIWDKVDFASRVNKILDDAKYSNLTSLTVETPIVRDGYHYKFTSCESNNFSDNHATIYYDAKNDNIMVLLEKNGGSERFSEKGRFYPSDKLEKL